MKKLFLLILSIALVLSTSVVFIGTEKAADRIGNELSDSVTLTDTDVNGEAVGNGELSNLVAVENGSDVVLNENDEESESTPSVNGVIGGHKVVVSGNIPEGATLSLTEVDMNTAQQIATDLYKKDAVFACDIKIIDTDGKEWQPDESVNVTVTNLEVNNNQKLGFLHIAEDIEAVVQQDNAEEAVEDLSYSDVTEKGKATFETKGFSTFIGYTVDFSYETARHSILGESDILLSDLFDALSINKDATEAVKVEFSDYSLMAVEQQADGDWLLTSLKPFTTQETLTITFAGEILVIDVTDYSWAKFVAGENPGAGTDTAPATYTITAPAGHHWLKSKVIVKANTKLIINVSNGDVILHSHSSLADAMIAVQQGGALEIHGTSAYDFIIDGDCTNDGVANSGVYQVARINMTQVENAGGSGTVEPKSETDHLKLEYVVFRNIRFDQTDVNKVGAAVRVSGHRTFIHIDSCKFRRIGGSSNVNYQDSDKNSSAIYFAPKFRCLSTYPGSDKKGEDHKNVKIRDCVFGGTSTTEVQTLRANYGAAIRVATNTRGDDGVSPGIDNFAIQRCDFIHCHVPNNGGAVYIGDNINNGTTPVYIGQFDVRGCSFDDCLAIGGGGGIAIDYGTSIADMRIIRSIEKTIRNSTFKNCTSRSTGGGAVFIDANVNLTVGGVDFSDCINGYSDTNTGGNIGGALVFSSAYNHNLTLGPDPDGSENAPSFLRCHSYGSDFGGGAMYIYNANTTIGKIKLGECTAPNGRGGGILVRGCSNFSLSNGDIFTNSAAKSGGAIYAEGCTNFNMSSTYLYNNSTTLPTAQSDGGAVTIVNANNTFTDCHFGTRPYDGEKFANRTCLAFGGYGGAIYANGGVTNITGGSFYNSVATNSSGGAIFADHSVLNITGTDFAGNSCPGYGGAIYCNGKLSISGTAEKKTLIHGNSAARGGGVYTLNNRFTMEYADVYSNTASSGRGGGLFLLNCIDTSADKNNNYIKNSNIYSNRVEDSSSHGGGINLDGGTLDIENTNIYNNYAGNSGGGVCVNHTSDAKVASICNFKSGNVYGNSAGVYGGGFFVQGTENYLAELHISDGTIGSDSSVSGSTGNTAPTGGGIACYTYFDVTMSGGTINGNSATHTNGNYGGGGVYVRWGGTFAMSGGTISNNKAINGGGVYLRYYGTTMDITGGTFTGNTASNSGAGVYVNEEADEKVSISNATFEKNIANDIGGAICVLGGADLELDNCNLGGFGDWNNRNESKYGGAVFIKGNKTLTVKNSTFYTNNATYFGGGILAESGVTLVMDNTTMKHCLASSSTSNENSGLGGAICIKDNCVSAEITNSNLSGNCAGSFGGAVYTTTNITIKKTNMDGNSAVNNSGGAVAAFGTASDKINVSIAGGTMNGNFTNGTYDSDDYEEGKGGAVYLHYANLDSSASIDGTKLTSSDTNGDFIKYYSTYAFSSTTVNGASKAYNAEHGGGIYVGTGSQAILEGGSISNCTSKASGGGVFVVADNKLTVNGGDIAGNEALIGSGGGIYLGANVPFVMNGGAVENCKATSNGGGIYAGSGVTIQISGGEISGNTTSGGNGGGIYTDVSRSMVIDGAAIISNNNAIYGGGIYIHKLASTAKIRAIDGTPVIRENCGRDSGGGIVIAGGELIIDGAKILDNYTEINSPDKMQDIDVKQFGGGGILLWLEEADTTLDFISGTVSGNSAKEGSGGGICASRKLNTNQHKGSIKIHGGTFTKNQAGNGGAIYSDYLTTLTMTGGTIGSRATATKDLHTTSALLTKYGNGSFLVPRDANIALGTADNEYGGGGGIYARGKTELSNVRIYGNVAAKGAGLDIGISEYTYDSKVHSGVVTSTNCQYVGNISVSEGGGVHLETCTATATDRPVFESTNDVISKNIAVNGGGVYTNVYTEAVFTNTNIDNNELRYFYPDIAQNNVMSSGCGVYSKYYVEMNGGSVSENKPSEDVRKVIIDGSEYTFPVSNVTGGGLFSQAMAVNKINGTEFIGNVATTMGGGLYIASTKGATEFADAYTNLNNVVISKNKLTSQAEGDGAGVYATMGSSYTDKFGSNYYSNFSINNSTISENECSRNGGGLYLNYVNGKALENNKIYGNKAENGGGLFSTAEVRLLSLTKNDFYDNTAIDQGGAIRNAGTVATTDCKIYNNTAVNGGGIYNASASYGNVAATFSATNTTVTNNKAVVGGGVYVIGYGSRVASCTVSKSDSYAPIFDNRANPDSVNTTSQGDDIYVASTARMTLPSSARQFADGEYGVWYSDKSDDRYRTGNPLSNPTVGYSLSGAEYAATFRKVTADVTANFDVLDPWGKRYVAVDGKNSPVGYEFTVSKDDVFMSKYKFTGDYEVVAFGVLREGKTDELANWEYYYLNSKDIVLVYPGDKLKLVNLTDDLQLREYAPVNPETNNSFISKMNFGKTGETLVNLGLDFKTKEVKYGLPVVTYGTSGAITLENNPESFSGNIVNYVYGAKVTVKYYDRAVEKGVAASMKTTPTAVSKKYVGTKYIQMYSNGSADGTGKHNLYSNMIAYTGALADNRAHGIDNLIDEYYLWTSQAGAKYGIEKCTIPGTENKYSSTAFHKDSFGNEVNGEKWVTYKTAGNAEVTPGEFNSTDDFAGTNYLDICDITVWMFNTPKVYDIAVYAAQRPEHLTPLTDGSGRFVSNNLRATYSSYYNQRFNGEMGDNSDIASEHLQKYGITNGYIDEYLSTAYRIRRSGANPVFFQYWSYDSEGKTVASIDISYAHRVTTDVELYAIYGEDEFNTTGLTLLGNDTDFYYQDDDNDAEGIAETEYVRFNTTNTPYCSDTVTEVASIFFVFDKDATIDEDALRDAFKAYLEGDTTALDQYSDICKVSTYGEGEFTLSTLNRTQFFEEYKYSDVVDKKVITFGAMLEKQWYISSNYVEYNIKSSPLDSEFEDELGSGTGSGDDFDFDIYEPGIEDGMGTGTGSGDNFDFD